MEPYNFERLRWLRRVVIEDKERLTELQCQAEHMGKWPTGAPTGGVGWYTDRVGTYAAKIADQRAILAADYRDYTIERANVVKYLASVPDKTIRKALALRFISDMTWRQVAEAVSDTTIRTITSRCRRYIA